MPRNEVPFTNALHAFLNQKLITLAQATIEKHEYELMRFHRWMRARIGDPNFTLSEVDPVLVNRYLADKRPPVVAPSTFNNRRQFNLAFWKFVTAEGWCATNPWRNEAPYPLPKPERLRLSPQELVTLLDVSTPRDRFAIALGINTGLRAGDLVGLRISAFDLQAGQLSSYVSKQRMAMSHPITADLHAETVRWFDAYAQSMGVPVSGLKPGWPAVPKCARYVTSGGFQTDDAVRELKYVPDQGILQHPERIVRRGLEAMGVFSEQQMQGTGFHTLRRSAARAVWRLARDEGDSDALGTAQAFLGHQNRQTTELYIGMTQQKQARDDLLQGKSFLGRAIAHEDARRVVQDGDDGLAGGLAAVR